MKQVRHASRMDQPVSLVLTGEVNTGKTTLTGQVAEALCLRQKISRVTVVDMAPTIPSQVMHAHGAGPIGGFVTFKSLIPDQVFQGGIYPPRLMGTCDRQIMELARANQKRIETWFANLLQTSPPDLLIINDMSIYLQAGSVRKLARVISHAPRVVANGYMGRTLGSDPLSRTEKQAMEQIIPLFRTHVTLKGSRRNPPS